MMARQNITDRAKRNPQPWTLPRADRSYYVHGLYGAKTATLAGSYGTKPEALKAARRLANEENEDVSISVPKGAMIVVHPNTATRKNLFGWGKPVPVAPSKRKRSSALTIGGASAQAREAGYRGRYNFRDWLEMKHLDERGSQVIDRLGQAYSAGQERREKDDQAKIDRTEAKRETARQKSEKRAESKAASYASAPDEKTIQEGFKRGLTLNEILRGNPALRKLKASNPAKFDRCVKAVQTKGGAANAYAVCTAAGTRKGRKNPASAAAEVFEEFHGFEPSEVVTVTKKVHYHSQLAAAGNLTHLDVWGVDGQGHRIKGFKGALLAFNEQKNQLFVEGGDQSVNLDDFGIRQAHEFETLGKVTDIGYATNKTHLGDEGGEAVYVHKFRSTNENGKHVVVRIAREPDLIYDVRNEQLLFSGGSYEILREGIDK